MSELYGIEKRRLGNATSSYEEFFRKNEDFTITDPKRQKHFGQYSRSLFGMDYFDRLKSVGFYDAGDEFLFSKI